jgi:N-acetylglutamate synthase-like GNAT family acetyltransferase
MDLATGVKLRVLTPGDVDAIAAIDKAVIGKERRDFWATKVEHLSKASAVPSLVAECEGRVVGFILGSSSGWEYGMSESVGWIDTIGVLPECRGKGISRALFEEMISSFKKVGLDKIYVFVSWKKWDLLEFFEKMGFSRGDMINLELKI